jgi:ADP-ribose pyrophosphatase
MTFEEKTIKSDRIYEGKIINLRKDTVTTKNGQSVREIVEHKGGAVIAAVTENGGMLMVRQYRKPSQCVMFEVPAGKIDPGEEPVDTALRELREETGYTARYIEYLTKMWPSVGYSEEILYIYLCADLKKGETDFDENEAIDIEEHDIGELFDMVMNGEIEDGKSQVAILMTKALLDSGRLDKYIK